jgi:hypothetical protein
MSSPTTIMNSQGAQFHQNFTIRWGVKQSPFDRRNLVIFPKAIKQPVPLDLKTVRILKDVLEDAWYSLSAEQQAMMSKTVLAERILRSAAKGERDRERLLAAALEIAA